MTKQTEVKCPKCGSHCVMVERRPDGNATCTDCRYHDKYEKFIEVKNETDK